jgi:hypothetical protein
MRPVSVNTAASAPCRRAFRRCAAVAVTLLTVAGAPRGLHAQGAQVRPVVVRHDLIGAVGAVTASAFDPPRRATSAEVAQAFGGLRPSLAGRVWVIDGSVRSNVAVRLVLEASAEGGALDGWQVLGAGGQLQPCVAGGMTVGEPVGPGRRATQLLLVAPDGASDAPPVLLRTSAL